MQSTYRKLTRPVHVSIVFLMLIGYVLMGCMMAEQNRTISAQRDLIRKLFKDSVQLSVNKMSTAQQSRQR
jgi:hypothetical protein